jgi:hypothetical protein
VPMTSKRKSACTRLRVRRRGAPGTWNGLVAGRARARRGVRGRAARGAAARARRIARGIAGARGASREVRRDGHDRPEPDERSHARYDGDLPSSTGGMPAPAPLRWRGWVSGHVRLLRNASPESLKAAAGTAL